MSFSILAVLLGFVCGNLWMGERTDFLHGMTNKDVLFSIAVFFFATLLLLAAIPSENYSTPARIALPIYLVFASCGAWLRRDGTVIFSHSNNDHDPANH